MKLLHAAFAFKILLMASTKLLLGCHLQLVKLCGYPAGSVPVKMQLCCCEAAAARDSPAVGTSGRALPTGAKGSRRTPASSHCKTEGDSLPIYQDPFLNHSDSSTATPTFYVMR